MSAKLQCPLCGARRAVGDHAGGRTFRCACGAELTIPALAPADDGAPIAAAAPRPARSHRPDGTTMLLDPEALSLADTAIIGSPALDSADRQPQTSRDRAAQAAAAVLKHTPTAPPAPLAETAVSARRPHLLWLAPVIYTTLLLAALAWCLVNGRHAAAIAVLLTVLGGVAAVGSIHLGRRSSRTG